MVEALFKDDGFQPKAKSSYRSQGICACWKDFMLYHQDYRERQPYVEKKNNSVRDK